jgi:hypothetical protein
VAAQSAAAAAYARTRSPPPGRGLRAVSRAIRIAIARPFGYHEAIRRADAAAVDGDVATAWRALADAEGALADGRRVLAVGGLLLGVGVSFPIARRVERAREPGRQKLAAEAAIRRAGVACANGHPDGHAVDRFSQSIAAFEDGAYGRAADIAKEAATAAEREQDLLETLADRTDATVDVITLYDPTPAMDRILEAIATTADATDDTDAVMTATSEAFETLEDRLDEGLMPDDGPEALAGSLPDSMSIDGASGDSDGSGGGDDPERPTSADPSKSDGAMNSDHPDGRRKQSGDQMDDRPHDGRDRSGAGDSDDETRRDDGGEVAGSPTEAASTDGDDAGDRPPAAHEDLIRAVNDAIREGDYDEARTQLTEVDQSDASIDSPASE